MDILVLALTVVLLMVLITACLLPVGADSVEDQGDGMTEVVIPRHVRTPRWRPRTLAFFGVTAILSLVFLTVRSLPALYATAVGNVADAITRDPATVNGYIARLRPALVFFGVAYIAGTAAVLRANLGRRLAVLGHGVLYLAMSILTQALMIAIGIASGWLVAPFGVEATLANLLIGGLVIMRLAFTTFVLPRATTVPLVRRPRLWDTVLTCCALVTVVTVLIAGYAYISEQSNLDSVLRVFLPLYAVTVLFIFMFAPLWLLWWVNRKLPVPGRYRPAVDIIIPAYNETDNVARLLRSIDLAAAHYGGPVQVVVSNDGSTDDTAQVAGDEIGNFRHARGWVLTGPNRRQSAALNRAIAATDAEIIIRVDADCVLGEDTLVYAVPWFEDPDIGSVGAMEEPRTDTVTWFHRMRVLETAFQFRFARLGQSLVDGITVIPGTFTAMRRGPVEEAGGFPVGMNGEDSDVTMQVGRLGYRVVIDPRIRCYEDVPRSPGEFVEQRTRWARAGFHVFARHVPLRAGSAGPRVWFWTLRRGFSWFSIQAGLIAPLFLLELLLTNASYRGDIVKFLALYAAGGGVVLAIALPYAARQRRYWRSILWAPTWVAYAFLRRIATLEAAISLPVRPFPAHARLGARPAAQGRAADEPTGREPASVLFGAAGRDRGEADPGWAEASPRQVHPGEADPGWPGGRWAVAGESGPRWADTDGEGVSRYDPVQEGPLADGPQDDPVPIPTPPGLLFPEDD
jgi:cellulose synthase/poly-beta-1,6-N-acetylglucosamine synthase-like glycosyltransferase